MAQLHKKFTDHQVKDLICRYLEKEIERSYIEEILGIKRRRFCQLVKKYDKDPDNFSIEYKKKGATRKISKDIEDSIIKELEIEKKLIADPEVPLRPYNYSYIKDRLMCNYNQKVSTPTIIDRAKKGGFYLKKSKKKAHDREVITNYIGELIQHDSSHHKWSPYAKSKWYLITSIDDYSRYMLYAKLFLRETSWAHIQALEEVTLNYGLAYSYYVDCHSTFRFVQGRDSLWRKHYSLTDDVDPQWKQVAGDLGIDITYALSPPGQGKN
ncbi:MAG: hypothetical protein HQ569_09460 [Actinobacteria bacterium]|nr:hypothetical protein [Actinomycetota bacterium]